jgi:hypothetical protein
MSIAGICYAVARAPKVIPPSAVASVLLRIPLMKQVCQYNVYATYNTWHLAPHYLYSG